MTDEDDALTRAEEAEFARRVAAPGQTQRTKNGEPPETLSSGGRRRRPGGLPPARGMGEGLLHDWGVPGASPGRSGAAGAVRGLAPGEGHGEGLPLLGGVRGSFPRGRYRLAARRRRRARDRERAAAQAPRRLRRPGQGPRAADPAAAQRAAPRPPAGPRAALRPARPRQDHDRDDHRRRARRAAPAHQRPGDRAVRRPGGRAVHPPGGRGRLHRRDPPPRPPRRGDALPGDGGLPGRHHRRQGAGRDGDPARHRPVHPGRRDHQGWPAARAAARPLRLHRAPGLLPAG